jgi:hypothetical protein
VDLTEALIDGRAEAADAPSWLPGPTNACTNASGCGVLASRASGLALSDHASTSRAAFAMGRRHALPSMKYTQSERDAHLSVCDEAGLELVA